MRLSRREFLVGAAGLAASQTEIPGVRGAHSEPSAPSRSARVLERRNDPWLEVDPTALRANAGAISRLAGNRPILAVVKNNAYGLGLGSVGPALELAGEVTGLAVVKADEALALRDAGVAKPILLMGRWTDEEAEELVRRGVRLTPFNDDDGARLSELGRRLGRTVPVHLYLDTGMSRLGVPFRRAVPWIADLFQRGDVTVEGTFMTFTEMDDVDPEQLERFLAIARDARARGLDLGRLHAASSHGVFFREPALLDMVRPGLVLYGAYPEHAAATGRAALTPAVRLRARVVRVERLEPGDGVSYGQSYVAERPTWVATLPVGHADGYPRRAVDGCEVLIDGRLYRVIGAVSASHTIIEVGSERTVEIGDEATLVGPEHTAVHPNTIAERAGISVYDVLMHLSARLPRLVRS